MAVNQSNAYYLIASWINCLLYMLELTLMLQYLNQRPRPVLHKVGMAAIFIFDTICTLAICVDVYTMLLSLACPTELPTHTALNNLWNSVGITLFATYAVASLEQVFLCYLHFALNKQRWVVAIMGLCIATHLGFSCTSAGLVMKTQSPFGAALMTSKVGAISCAVTDVLLASLLMYSFIQLEKTHAVSSSTQSLLRRFMLLTATSGALVASVTLMDIILLLRLNDAFSLFYFAQGRVYSLTILINFLVGNPRNPRSSSLGPGDAPTNVSNVVFHVIDYNGNNIRTRSHLETDIDMDALRSYQSPSKQSPTAPSSETGHPNGE